VIRDKMSKESSPKYTALREMREAEAKEQEAKLAAAVKKKKTKPGLKPAPRASHAAIPATDDSHDAADAVSRHGDGRRS
jgi:hypothetical protein